ncbi:hypothetical protein QQ045_023546 [Rhodiola kirilowii]
MGSGYYGEMNMGNNNVSSSSNSGSSSRRKKKSSNSPNKPKQPQRGLGVAQLEKIRLHGQMGYFPNNNISPAGPYMSHHNLNYPQEAYGTVPPSGSSYGFHQPNMMMGFGDMERPEMGWNLNNGGTGYFNESQQVHYSQADYMTRPFLGAEETGRNKNEWGRSGSHDSESSDTQQEVDLELRL